jgi:hypothetical protein
VAKPAKWSWNASNVNASVEQTQTAYQALTTASDVGHGPTRNFSVIVWNDIVNKIVEQRQYWGDIDWSRLGITQGQTFMIPGNRITADRFNACVLSMPPIHPWGWEATLGRKEIKKGDVCYGTYFLYLVDGLNHWIDLTPLPFIVNMPIHSRLDSNILVRRALHVISNQNIKWWYNADVTPLRALHTKGRLRINTDIHLTLPLYNTKHVIIVLFGNTRFKNTTIVADAMHIVADNNIRLDIAGRITFSDVVFLICDVTGQSELTGTLNIPPSVRILIDNLIELTDEGKVTVSLPQGFSASVLGQFIGEAWVREPDSLAIKEDLQIVHNGSLTFTFSEILRILANLNTKLTHRVRLTISDTQNILADLGITLEQYAAIRDNRATQLKGELAATFESSAMMYRKRLTTHGGDLTMKLITSATATFAAHEIYTAADLIMQSDMSATATFARRELYTGASLIHQSLMTARAELTNNKIPMSTSLFDTFSIDVTAAVNPNIMGTGAVLTDTTIGSTAAFTINPGNVLPLGAQLSNTSEILATISTFDNRLYAGGNVTGMHTGSGKVQLIDAIEFAGGASSEFSCSADLDINNAERIRVDMEFTHTGSATITTQRYVLVSEIDDVLVSDLDDMLVTDVEFHY